MGKRDHSYRPMCMHAIISNKNSTTRHLLKRIPTIIIGLELIFKISNKTYRIDYTYKIWDKFKMHLKVHWSSACDRNLTLI